MYKEMTKAFEGLRLKPYKCSAGKTTIGYGRNLEDVGISKLEADYLFNADWNRAVQDAMRICKDYDIDYKQLIEQRFYVLTDMCFNMGYARTKAFKKMLTALKKGLYEDASKEMLDSMWAKQVGNRAIKLAHLMKG
jgi:lysozyme